MLAHDETYVQRFLNDDLSKSEIKQIGLSPWKKEMIERTMRLTGGSLGALNSVLDGDLFAANLGGVPIMLSAVKVLVTASSTILPFVLR